MIVGASKRVWQGRVDVAFTILVLMLTFARQALFGQAQAAGQELQLSISAESPAAVEPFPVRLILHFHNSGNKPLWLYKPVRDAAAMSQSALGPNPGGSTLAVHLEPEAVPQGSQSVNPALGTLFRPVRMPHPRLISVAPGGNYLETLAIHIAPAVRRTGNASAPIWGTYRIVAAYTASYSNGAATNRDLGVDVWQGSVSSNPVLIQLQPASAVGSISGTVLNRQMEQDWGILVSLSDVNEHVVDQTLTGNDGGFSFSHLPFGRYWVTVRTPGSETNTGFFEHADLSASSPDAKLKLIMLPTEEDDAKQMLHRPVLFRIRDNAGNPLPGAELDILWSNGPVMESLKAKTNEDGLAEINLLPGSNYVTVRRRNCPKQDQMVNVDSGPGIDGFSIVSDCGKQ